jgi:hypothetical protein
MKSLQEQLSPTNRYYLGKLLKTAGKSLDQHGQGLMEVPIPQLTAEQLSQLENLLRFHQSLSNQYASSASNLDQVTGLIFGLLNIQQFVAPEPEDKGFGQPSLAEELLIDEGLVDKQALLAMPLPELIKLVEALRKSVEGKVSFVNDQEEELTLQRQTIQELQQTMAASNEYERLLLEKDLAEEQQSYEFLEATLVGQRKRIQDELHLLQIHQNILRYRQES